MRETPISDTSTSDTPRPDASVPDTPSPDTPPLARRMWQLLEPVHALLYYAPEAFGQAAVLGYDTDTRWPSYFAWRASPLGAAGPHQVTSAFYSFSPATVATYVPAVWEVAAPEKVREARWEAVDRAYRALLVDVGTPALAEAAALAREAAEAAPLAGRTLAAANADLPWPDVPHLQLWQAATILREQRGDGHITALVSAGLDPVEALVSFAALGVAPVEVFASRGWTDGEWAAARDRLVARGWVRPDGTATEEGRAGRAAVERETDALAAAPWEHLGPERAGRLARAAAPVTQAVVASGVLPRQSTLGLGRPAGGNRPAPRG